MRIAQIAPLFESVPPKMYGGTERIVSFITERLVELGHEVTVFASGDSVTKAELVSPCPQALRLGSKAADPWPNSIVMLDQVRRRATEFDILHFHIDFFHFPTFRPRASRTLTTLHGRLDLPDLANLYGYFADMPLVSISLAQRHPMPPVRWAGNVYHGLPRTLYQFAPKSEGYLAFLGRICPEKRPDLAIEIARRAGLPLKIAAKVDPVDQAYFDAVVRPLLNEPEVEFIGEIGEAQKGAFLAGARAVLFPIDWPEPFGLVMIEAMACGTPIIAYRRGSVPEIIEDGVTGRIVDTIEEAVSAVSDIALLDRGRIRARFEARFTVERMVDDYLLLYGFALEDLNGRAADANVRSRLPAVRSAPTLKPSGRRDCLQSREALPHPIREEPKAAS